MERSMLKAPSAPDHNHADRGRAAMAPPSFTYEVERAIELLRVAASFIRQHASDQRVDQPDSNCDGAYLADECDYAAKHLSASSQLPQMSFDKMTREERMALIRIRATAPKPRVRPAAQQYVYFIACGSRVKIGRSVEPGARRRGLEQDHQTVTGKPKRYQMLVSAPVAEKQVEGQLHGYLSRHHIGGEWFEKRGLVLEVVRRIKAGESVAAILSTPRSEAAPGDCRT